jgi:hypothetical protein
MGAPTPTPGVFAVVRESDWWDASRRHLDIAVDSRLRAIYHSNPTDLVYRCGAAAGARMPSQRPIYAEIESTGLSSSLRWQAGLVLAGADVAAMGPASTDTNASHNAVIYGGAGTIHLQGVTIVASGLAQPGRLGIRLRDDDGTAKCQFYVNGAPQGSEQSLSAGARRLLFCGGKNDRSAMLHVDADDMLHLPDDCDPWGAAARVSDFGGYSPAATLWADWDAAVSVDSYRRVCTANVNNRSIRAGGTTRTTRKVYWEFPIEAKASNGIYMGIAARSSSLAATIGANSLGWSLIETGFKRHSGSNTEVPGSGGGTAGDRYGCVWEPATGKLWFTKGWLPVEGDPQAGTGASFTNVVGDLLPACTPGDTANGNRVRLCTHAREQLYRPSYAEAWDGADMLPEQYYRGSLARGIEVTQRVRFQPWGGSRGNALIGAVELLNGDGRYEPLASYDLRNSDLSVYTVAAGIPQHAARGVVETIQRVGQTMLRVLCSDRSVILDKRIDRPVVALGRPRLVPPKQVNEHLVYDICDSPLFRIDALYDMGMSVSNFRRGDASIARGFVRTVAPAGKQAVLFEVFRRHDTAAFALDNSAFASWSGDNPTGWITTETGAADNRVTQSGSAARFIRGAGTAELRIAQGNFVQDNLYFVRVKVTAYVSGSLKVHAVNDAYAISYSAELQITGTGEWYGFINSAFWGQQAQFRLVAEDGTDLTVDEVEVIVAESTREDKFALKALLRDIGGLAASDYYEHPVNFRQRTRIGYWTDRRPTVLQLLVDLLGMWLASYYTDARGRLCIVDWCEEPEQFDETASAFAGLLTEGDVIGELSVDDDTAPALSDLSQAHRNWSPYAESELAGGISPPSLRRYITQPYLVNKLNLASSSLPTDAQPLHPFYSHALGAAPPPRAYADATNTSPTVEAGLDYELYRVHRAYARRRHFYEGEFKVARVPDVSVGSLVRLRHPREGLADGKMVQVIEISGDVGAPTRRFRFWG